MRKAHAPSSSQRRARGGPPPPGAHCRAAACAAPRRLPSPIPPSPSNPHVPLRQQERVGGRGMAPAAAAARRSRGRGRDARPSTGPALRRQPSASGPLSTHHRQPLCTPAMGRGVSERAHASRERSRPPPCGYERGGGALARLRTSPHRFASSPNHLLGTRRGNEGVQVPASPLSAPDRAHPLPRASAQLRRLGADGGRCRPARDACSLLVAPGAAAPLLQP